MKIIINPHDIPPFSILDARSSKWLNRKKYWYSLGIQCELGRGEELTYKTDSREDYVGSLIQSKGHSTSIFDPVLTEVIYNWFTAPDMRVLDPFAGGSVRGVVASMMNRQYKGVELRKEQVQANIEQLHIVDECTYNPVWLEGDSNNLDLLIKGKFDFIFSCPPYHSHEQYSDLKNDLSNMSWDKFLISYRRIIKKSVAKLKNNRFACFVVSDFRNGDGCLKPLVAETIRAFEDAGMGYYNEMILQNMQGSLALRANNSMYATRKIGRAHQNILVFVKGDAREAAELLNERGGVKLYKATGVGKYKNALKQLKKIGYCQNKQLQLRELGLTISTVKKCRIELDDYFINGGANLVMVTFNYRGSRKTVREYYVTNYQKLIDELELSGHNNVEIL